MFVKVLSTVTNKNKQNKVKKNQDMNFISVLETLEKS